MAYPAQVTKKEVSPTLKVGGNCAIVVGILGALFSLNYLLLPPEQRIGANPADLLPSFDRDPTLLRLEMIEMALAGVCGMGLAPAVSEMLEALKKGGARWTGTLATFSYGVMAVSNLLMMQRLPGVASAYVHGDASTKAALAATWNGSIDPDGWMQYGCVGLWMLVVNTAASQSEELPKPLAYLGMALGVLYCLKPISATAQMPELMTPMMGLGAILAPLWYLWMGFQMRSKAEERTAPPPQGNWPRA
ncbi:MAG TPA: DUF4386 family protein [Ktedonobacterales bacterium]|jgi:multisubunit Na+/H+ antiporter MnhB subunit